MWLNKEKVIDSMIRTQRKTLLNARPNHIVIDNLFDSSKLDEVMLVLQKMDNWLTQTHTYAALHVDEKKWQNTPNKERFVMRDVWQPDRLSMQAEEGRAAKDFLLFLRSKEFMSLLSRIFDVQLTDINVAKPAINSNFFRLTADDFVNQHADDSPGREVCMLLYLNKIWNNSGGELVFMGEANDPIQIAPIYNRCVLFNPSSKGSEHWVKPMLGDDTVKYRYNVTSWYWSK